VFAYLAGGSRDGSAVVTLMVADRQLASLTVDEAVGAVTVVVANGVERGELLGLGLSVEPGGELARVYRAVPLLAVGLPMLCAAA
jgi:hypothetical protein